jgi:hypothetical protein
MPAQAFVKTGRRSRLGQAAKLIKSSGATLSSVNPETYCLVYFAAAQLPPGATASTSLFMAGAGMSRS